MANMGFSKQIETLKKCFPFRTPESSLLEKKRIFKEERVRNAFL